MINEIESPEEQNSTKTAIGFTKCWPSVLCEYIICAAIWFDNGEKYNHQPKNIKTGFVVAGRRHHNCYITLQAIGKAIGYEKHLFVKKGLELEKREIQGFITNKDRFVDRKEAAKIAYEAGQVEHEYKGLISESLY